MSENSLSFCDHSSSLNHNSYDPVETRETRDGAWPEYASHYSPCEREATLVNESAHDFRNILYVVTGFTQLALNSLETDSTPAQRLSMVLSAAERGAQIVEQMLARARRDCPRRFPIDIRPIVEETVKFVRASADEDISVRLTMSEDMRPALADSTQIHQLLMNLCSNALHAMRGGGGVLHVELNRVELGGDARALHSDLRPGPYLSLSVSDTGSGMDQALAERIFEPYFTTKEEGEGAGLGLTVVKRIVETHGGAMTLETAPGKGACFRAFLPTVECALTSCSGRPPASLRPQDRAAGQDALARLRQDMALVHEDMDLLENDLKLRQIECGPHVRALRIRVQDVAARLNDALSGLSAASVASDRDSWSRNSETSLREIGG